ncbi:osmotically inducible protein OsmC [Seonamhaeicola sp. S2-3]|uniref:OsmC family protein n=1 Tax=Seonamhaeicola sp. S2-3 TaxID=1936081 RepID=UPI000972E540|nr:OsmC family protein [Seonamhaeicola sp. S2-3]APY10268.1 osmotically inducible protein OsmC [Seonamhaeicola sp. S2-3]
MATEHYYQVNVNWNKNRNGILTSNNLDEKITIATPPEFPKGEANIWSPEHYFVAAINGCLMTTFLAVAENFKLDFIDFESNAVGKLEMIDRKFVMSEVILNPVVTISNEDQKALAIKVLEKSEKACLITNSVKSNIKMNITIKVV